MLRWLDRPRPGPPNCWAGPIVLAGDDNVLPEAIFEWEHGIAPRKRDVWQGMSLARGRRVSVTFRFREHARATIAHV